MLRTTLATVGMLILGATGFGQKAAGLALPAMSVKDAGTYHLATGAWTRGGARAVAWTDIIFDNTCSVGYYAPHAVTTRYVDDGRIPSTSSPTNPGPPASAISWTGYMDTYRVVRFQIGYCTFDPLPTYEINFWECFSGCQDSTLVSPTASFLLTNLPGGLGTGSGCWTVNINLTNSGWAFLMNADCDGIWSGGGVVDTFGWSGQQVSPSTGGTPGPLITGDPSGYLNGGPGSSGCEFGANTAMYAGSSPTSEGTGLDGLDLWEHDTMSPTPSFLQCWWYGGYANGNLYASFHMRIADELGCCGSADPGFQYCPGDGSGTQCPYLNNNDGSASPGGGCDWGSSSFPEGGILTATGDPDFANPDVTFIATSVENDFGIFFGAYIPTNGGAGGPLNDGLRCAGGGLIRLNSPTLATGNMATLGPIEAFDSNAGPGITRRYQYWFRTPNGPGGTMANLTNGYKISWL